MSYKWLLYLKKNSITKLIANSPYFFIVHQHEYKTTKLTNMWLFMSMIFILIQIKFIIDINNDELLKTISKHLYTNILLPKIWLAHC